MKLARVLNTDWLARSRRIGHGIQRKIMADADDICSKNQANKITEGLRNFLDDTLIKKVTIIPSCQERSRGHATNTISVRNSLVESGNNIFQSYYLEK